MPEKTPQPQNRIREALGRLYDHHPPHFREYLRRYQEDPTSRVFAPLAEAYRRLGRVDEAIDICTEGLTHHPEFHGGRVALARCYFDKKMLREAKQELERVIQLSPENLLAQRLLGDCYLGLKDPRQALHYFKMALLLAPEDVALQEKAYQLERELNAAAEVNEAEVKTDLLTMQSLRESVSNAEGISNAEAVSNAEEPISAPESASLLPIAPEMPAEDDVVMNAPFGSVLAADSDPETLFEDPQEAEIRRARVDAILGVDEEENDGDAFKIEAVHSVFTGELPRNPEITTQTLGDLYFSQGQFEKSLKIFEKLNRARPSSELVRKISDCRARLGVDEHSRHRQKRIDMLNAILKKNRQWMQESTSQGWK